MQETVKILKSFGVPLEMRVTSAHRTPRQTHEYVTSAADRGIRILIAGAGAAAHLAGAAAAGTHLPVIGVPLSATDLQGMDALLATVQMPGGLPVATMAIGKAGAKNAGILAVQILALNDAALSEQLKSFRAAMVDEVDKKNAALQKRLAEL